MAVIGRPRDPEVDDAALAATVTLIVEGGYSGLTMDRIAARAAVSKAALYRRWPNKLELAARAVERYAEAHVTVPDTGTVRGDVIEMLVGFLRSRRDQAETFAALREAISVDPDLWARCRGLLLADFAAAFTEIIRRGVARGDLPVDTDIELLASLPPALVQHRRQTTGQPLDEAFVDRIADQFFAPGRGAGG